MALVTLQSNSKAGWMMAALLLLQAFAPPITAQTSSDSCNANLSLDLAFESSTLKCEPVWSGNGFILRFEQNGNVLNILLSAPYGTTGWVGMGFSNNGLMVGSSAMVGWRESSGNWTIQQYYLGGQTPNAVKPDNTESRLAVVSKSQRVHYQGSTIYLSFQIQFNEPVKSKNILFAYGSATPVSDQLSKHTDETSVVFDFSTGTSSSASASTDALKRNHGALNIFAWGVLLPIGAIIARYCRQWDPAWFYLHVGFQVSGFIFGVAGIVLGVTLYNKLAAAVHAHRGIGIFILVLGIFQVLALLFRPEKDAKMRKYWNWGHQWIGRLLIFLAAVNIVYGIHLAEAGNSWKVGYGFVVAILLVSVIALESLLWIRWYKRPIEPPAFQMYSTHG
jgi:hypothetical protein